MIRRIAAAVFLVLAVAGCSTSRYYEFTPDNPRQNDSKYATDVECGHVDLVVTGNANDRFEIGRFCKVDGS